jgi:hypothetical protein
VSDPCPTSLSAPVMPRLIRRSGASTTDCWECCDSDTANSCASSMTTASVERRLVAAPRACRKSQDMQVPGALVVVKDRGCAVQSQYVQDTLGDYAQVYLGA